MFMVLCSKFAYWVNLHGCYGCQGCQSFLVGVKGRWWSHISHGKLNNYILVGSVLVHPAVKRCNVLWFVKRCRNRSQYSMSKFFIILYPSLTNSVTDIAKIGMKKNKKKKILNVKSYKIITFYCYHFLKISILKIMISYFT